MIEGIPHLNGLNTTEWWIVAEALNSGNFTQIKSSGFAEYFEFTIRTTGGDIYRIEEFSEIVNSCTKLKEEEEEET